MTRRGTYGALVGSVALLGLLTTTSVGAVAARNAPPAALTPAQVSGLLLPLPPASRPSQGFARRPWTGAASLVDVAAMVPKGTRTGPGVVRGQQPAGTGVGWSSYSAAAATPGTSTNWSGYIVGTGRYTAVTGTFTVPTVATSSAETDTAEWVGIGGTVPGGGLIQAGVQEVAQPGASISTWAWWEILPAPETPIPSMAVTPGDSVTVSIWQVSGTLWGIALTDVATGQTFATQQTYSGSQTSAEWIVEAPSGSLSGTQETLGAYSPPVIFSDLRMNGPETTLEADTMVQDGVAVSVPSDLTTGGFSVAYGSAPSSPPAPVPSSTPAPVASPSPETHTITLGQQFNLTASGIPNSQVQWEVSPDAAGWSVLTTVTLDASGRATYTFGPSQTAYYRAFFLGSGQYGLNVIEVVVVPATPSPPPTGSPAPPTDGVPPHSTSVPPPGLTQLSSTDWLAGPALATSLGGAIVHVAASDSEGPIDYYRSLDGGLTFAPPVALTTPGASGYTPALTSGGAGLVIAAWAAPTGTGLHGVMVVRSTDFGAKWSAPTLLFSGNVRTDSSVAVTSDGAQRVVVSWVDASGRVTLRVSTNGGATFKSPVRLGTALKGYGAALAFSAGTLVAVWQTPTHAVIVRRNSAAGIGSWTAPVTLDTAAVGGFPASVAARGSYIVVAYTVATSGKWRATVRVSTDRGLRWSARRLAPTTSRGEGVAGVVAPASGKLQLVTMRVVGRLVDQVDVVPASNYGASWGAATRLSDPRYLAVADAVAHGSRTLVLFWTSADLLTSTGLQTSLYVGRY